MLFHKGIEAARPKTLEEARAELVNDYQSVVEARLIERLRQMHRVHTFPERLIRAFNDPSTETATSTE